MIRIMASAIFAGIAALLMAATFGQAVAQSNLQTGSPELKTQTGQPLTNAVAGELSIISATIDSNGTSDQNFIAIVEARSSIGITELLEFQTGQVGDGNIVEIGISWPPVEPGEYELRSFLLSDLQEPEVLSEVTTKTITVEEN